MIFADWNGNGKIDGTDIAIGLATEEAETEEEETGDISGNRGGIFRLSKRRGNKTDDE